jgi:hypothetical protein
VFGNPRLKKPDNVVFVKTKTCGNCKHLGYNGDLIHRCERDPINIFFDDDADIISPYIHTCKYFSPWVSGYEPKIDWDSIEELKETEE